MAQAGPESSAPCEGQEMQGLGAASAACSEFQRASSLPTSYRVWHITKPEPPRNPIPTSILCCKGPMIPSHMCFKDTLRIYIHIYVLIDYTAILNIFTLRGSFCVFFKFYFIFKLYIIERIILYQFSSVAQSRPFATPWTAAC